MKLIAIGVLLLAGLAAVVFVNFDGAQPKIEPQRFPDGSLVTLVQVNFGKTNLPLNETILERLRRRYVPASGFAILGRQLVPPLPKPTDYGLGGVPAGGLAFLLRHSVPSNSTVKLMPAHFATRDNTRVFAIDELGNEQEVPGWSETIPNPRAVATNVYISKWWLTSFPRDGKLMGLRILKKSYLRDWHTVAEFMIRNPHPPPHPRWQAEPQPVTRKIGTFEFTMADFQVGINPNGLARANVQDNARATFRVTDNGRPTDTWLARQITLTDASGNHCTASTETNQPTQYRFDGPLNPNEPWKLRVEFARQKDFPEEDLWRIAAFDPPKELATNLHGTRVIAKIKEEPDHPQYPSAWTHSVYVQLDGQPADMRGSLAEARGEQGNVIEIRDWGGNATYAMYQLKPEKPEKMELTVAVQKSLFVEFVVQPKIIALTNGAERLPDWVKQ